MEGNIAQMIGDAITTASLTYLLHAFCFGAMFQSLKVKKSLLHCLWLPIGSAGLVFMFEMSIVQTDGSNIFPWLGVIFVLVLIPHLFLARMFERRLPFESSHELYVAMRVPAFLCSLPYVGAGVAACITLYFSSPKNKPSDKGHMD